MLVGFAGSQVGPAGPGGILEQLCPTSSHSWDELPPREPCRASASACALHPLFTSETPRGHGDPRLPWLLRVLPPHRALNPTCGTPAGELLDMESQVKFRKRFKAPCKASSATCKAGVSKGTWRPRAPSLPSPRAPAHGQPAGEGDAAGEGARCWQSRDAHGAGTCPPGLLERWDGQREGVSASSCHLLQMPWLERSLPSALHRKMDYSTVRLMGFHFAKHLSLLVLDSEREISFDCKKAASVCNM